jgi:predicted DNA-binding transcriptional regulator YafY
MQSSADGLTLDQIGERFRVDRRTATRMRDAVTALFPGAESFRGDDGKKHWRIPNGATRSLVQFDAEELAALEAAAKLAERDGRPDQVAALQSVARKAGGVAGDARRRTTESSVGALKFLLDSNQGPSEEARVIPANPAGIRPKSLRRSDGVSFGVSTPATTV